jgi:hypothetical protein
MTDAGEGDVDDAAAADADAADMDCMLSPPSWPDEDRVGVVGCFGRRGSFEGGVAWWAPRALRLSLALEWRLSIPGFRV